jgi:D-alanyl-D-alanine carboxypeptidase (penicillin-binding protein 5/6)
MILLRDMVVKAKRKSKRPIILWMIIIVLLISGYVVWVTTRALPYIRPVKAVSNISETTPNGTFAWPTYGQAAIGLNSLGVLATNGTQQSVPMASTAKLITAIAVLSKKPLILGQKGPTITLNLADVQIYDKYLGEGGSVAAVVSGEQISEYQMLQAMLLPSADNMADSLAIWAFGSISNYNDYANTYLKTLGLNDTKVGVDASGYDPSSTTSASDLVRLGEAANQNPVIGEIVSQSNASNIPVVGTIHNINVLIGYENIDGIKTGNTDQAGGVFVSSSTIIVNKQPVKVFTSIMGAPSLWEALHSSAALVSSAQSNFAAPATIGKISSGSVVGRYIIPWSNQQINAVASKSVNVEAWKGTKVTALFTLNPITLSTTRSDIVGNITTQTSLPKTITNTPVVVDHVINSQPSKWWIITHPKYVL